MTISDNLLTYSDLCRISHHVAELLKSKDTQIAAGVWFPNSNPAKPALLTYHRAFAPFRCGLLTAI